MPRPTAPAAGTYTLFSFNSRRARPYHGGFPGFKRFNTFQKVKVVGAGNSLNTGCGAREADPAESKRDGRSTPPAGRNPFPSGGRKLGPPDGGGTEARSGGRRGDGSSVPPDSVRRTEASVRRTESGGTELPSPLRPPDRASVPPPSGGPSFRPPDGNGFRPAGGVLRPSRLDSAGSASRAPQPVFREFPAPTTFTF